ncbi:hypothetical protein [Alkaliphilus transvaalensis]|uniref:hypothetical protein n=1 Tax=Alkaliphilus transvaalensis TaxID=114628 RepID=UPI00047E66BE|nr:hypothetical protein [Alkaliphilus transvaalensis]
MEKVLEQILMELKDIKNGQITMQNEINEIKTEIKQIKTEINEIKLDGKATREQTAELIEFRTEIKQDMSDVKDTLRFLMYKEIQTEKEIFTLKQVQK